MARKKVEKKTKKYRPKVFFTIRGRNCFNAEDAAEQWSMIACNLTTRFFNDDISENQYMKLTSKAERRSLPIFKRVFAMVGK